MSGSIPSTSMETEEELELRREQAASYPTTDEVDEWFCDHRDKPAYIDIFSIFETRCYHFQLVDFREKCEATRIDHYHQSLKKYTGSFDLREPNSAIGKSGVWGYYQVLGVGMDGYELISHHVDLHGFELEKFKTLYLDHRSMELHHLCHFYGELIQGDMVKVACIREDKTNQKWRVHDYIIMPRTILKNVYLLVINHNGVTTIICKHSPYVCLNHPVNQNIPKTEVGTIKLFIGTVFLPNHTEPNHSMDIREDVDMGKLEYLQRKNMQNKHQHFGIVLDCRPADDKLKEMMHISLKDYRDKEARERMMEKYVLIIMGLQYKDKDVLERDHRHNNLMCSRNGDKVEFTIDDGYENTIAREGAKVEMIDKAGRRTIVRIEKNIHDTNECCFNVSGREENEDGKDDFNFSRPVVARVEKLIKLQSIYEQNCTIKRSFISDIILFNLHNGPAGHVNPIRKEREQLPRSYPRGMTDQQDTFVQMIANQNPVSALRGPKNSGKTRTLIFSIDYMYKVCLYNGESKPNVLVMAEKQEAVEKLVYFAEKQRFRQKKLIMMRFIIEEEWLQLSWVHRTAYDLPKLMEHFYLKTMTTFVEKMKSKPDIVPTDIEVISFEYIKAKKLQTEWIEEASEAMGKSSFKMKWSFEQHFLVEYRPEIIFCTVDNALDQLPTMLANCQVDGTPWRETISTLFMDEANLTPLYKVFLLTGIYRESILVLAGNDKERKQPEENLDISQGFRDFAMENVLDAAARNNTIFSWTLNKVFKDGDDDVSGDEADDDFSEESEDDTAPWEYHSDYPLRRSDDDHDLPGQKSLPMSNRDCHQNKVEQQCQVDGIEGNESTEEDLPDCFYHIDENNKATINPTDNEAVKIRRQAARKKFEMYAENRMQEKKEKKVVEDNEVVEENHNDVVVDK